MSCEFYEVWAPGLGGVVVKIFIAWGSIRSFAKYSYASEIGRRYASRSMILMVGLFECDGDRAGVINSSRSFRRPAWGLQHSALRT